MPLPGPAVQVIKLYQNAICSYCSHQRIEKFSVSSSGYCIAVNSHHPNTYEIEWDIKRGGYSNSMNTSMHDGPEEEFKSRLLQPPSNAAGYSHTHVLVSKVRPTLTSWIHNSQPIYIYNSPSSNSLNLHLHFKHTCTYITPFSLLPLLVVIEGWNTQHI